MKILLIGRSGQIGWELQNILSSSFHVVAPSSHDLNLTDIDTVVSAVRKIKPHLIINAAAYNYVDKAESEFDIAMAINAYAVGVLAEEARKIDAKLIHFSTDYVFDGYKEMAYVEEDFPNPINMYGASKLHGDFLIKSINCRHIIFRVSWIYGLRGNNFLLKMLKALQTQRDVFVVNDQRGAPSCSALLAECVANAAINRPDVEGLYHLASHGSASWYDFAIDIRDFIKSHHKEVAEVKSITSCEYPYSTKRPANSLMNMTKFEHDFGITLPHWKEDLDKVFAGVRL